MIKKLLSWLPALIVLSACETGFPVASQENSIVIKIESRDETSLKQDILMRLRWCKAKDVKEQTSNGVVYITAAFRAQDVAFNKVMQLGQELQEIPNVLHVDFERNRSVVKQEF